MIGGTLFWALVGIIAAAIWLTIRWINKGAPPPVRPAVIYKNAVPPASLNPETLYRWDEATRDYLPVEDDAPRVINWDDDAA